MYYRRKILLALLERGDGRALEKLALQKLLFLFCQQSAGVYHFVPYRYGMYSFTANNDLRVLTTHYKLIEADEKTYRAVPDERCYYDELRGEDQKILSALMREHGDCDTGALISFCYDRHPYYTINSGRALTAEQVGRRDEQWQKIRAQRSPALFTIGYEGISLEQYMNKLIRGNVALLCDVRKNPLSMKYGFSKRQLSACCESVGIAYRHLPALGIDSDKRQKLQTAEDYARLFAGYRDDLANRQEAIESVLALYEKHERIALTCFEGDHHCCHRSVVAEAMQNRYNLDCVHL